MNNEHPESKVGITYISIFAIAVLLSWVLHEFAHWSVGEILGNNMVMTMNSGYTSSGRYSQDWHYLLISAAGPIFTLCEAVLVFILMKQQKRLLLYPFLFTCFYMRLFAAIISVRNANDEARISIAFGIGKFTLPIIISIIFFILIYKISKLYHIDIKFNLYNLGLVILFSSIIILADMYFKIQLL